MPKELVKCVLLLMANELPLSERGDWVKSDDPIVNKASRFRQATIPLGHDNLA